MQKRKTSQKRKPKGADRSRSSTKKVAKTKAATKKAAPKKAAKPKPAPAPEPPPVPEPERDKATGAIVWSIQTQDHAGPADPNAERTVRSLQRFTNTTLPKGPWIEYRGRPGSAFDGQIRKAYKVSGLFVCVDADGTESTCEHGYVIYDEPGRHPSPVPADAFEDHFEAVTPDPKN